MSHMVKGSTKRPLRLLPVVIGAGILAHLISRTGTGAVTHHLKDVGWGLVLIPALGGISHLLEASGWRLTFRSDVRSLSLARVFGLRLVAEAGGTFGLAGLVVGDSMRVSLLGPEISIEDRISSVALDRAVHVVISGTVAATGILAAVMLLSLGGVWRIYALAFAAIVAIVLMLALFSFVNGWHLVPHLTRALLRLPWGRKWLIEKGTVVESAEESVLSFRSRSPKTFWAVIALYLLSQMSAIAEVYLLLRFMGLECMMVGAFVIEALTKLINVVGTLNPGNIGTYEGGNLVVARLLHFPATAGLTLAVCRRASILFWAAVGALCLAAWSPRQRAEIRRGMGEPETVA